MKSNTFTLFEFDMASYFVENAGELERWLEDEENFVPIYNIQKFHLGSIDHAESTKNLFKMVRGVS